MAAMGSLSPSRPPRLVGEVIGTGRLHGKLVGALSDRFRVTLEDKGPLSSELRAGQFLHPFLRQLIFDMDLVPRLECITFMGVYQDGMERCTPYTYSSQS